MSDYTGIGCEGEGAHATAGGTLVFRLRITEAAVEISCKYSIVGFAD